MPTALPVKGRRVNVLGSEVTLSLSIRGGGRCRGLPKTPAWCGLIRLCEGSPGTQQEAHGLCPPHKALGSRTLLHRRPGGRGVVVVTGLQPWATRDR